ncbi:glycoside hydrolase family 5 protein [Aestuariimicrobium soli]|uniref:glycoside hydrolase family 5 protein n=1 Tax=Aestuariimicrobium soli TaxID=2035834 RepID=UPI003EBF45AC
MHAPATGFVRREGTQLLGPDGKPTHFRGVGIGNWLLPEGYMWRFFAGATRPRLMERRLAELAGREYGDAFWPRFRDVFFTADDVAAIKAAGFDHVRLPFNWRLFMDETTGDWVEEGFTRLQQAVDWCRAEGLLVLLDLHGAPGGQTGANIDDSEHDRPEVFESPHRERCLALWVEVARRFADDTTVMGYDLLNEPCRDEFQHRHADDLALLYRDLSRAIRTVDPHHLLMYEGSHWATNVSIFTDPAHADFWDENSCLQFHRYWDAPDRDGLARFLAAADQLDRPLYMGEGGENSVGWLRAAFGSYDQLGISWNFWPWKKLHNPSSPADAPAPEGWDEVVAVFEATDPQGSGPTAERTRELFDAVLESFRLERCTQHQALLDALLQAPRGVLPAYAVEHRWGEPVGSGVRALDGWTIEHRGGDQGANPFSADPAERARAGEHVLLLAPGERATFRVAGRPAEAQVIGSSSASIEMHDDRLVVTGGPGGSEVVGIRLG